MEDIDRLVDRQRQYLEQSFAQKHERLVATTEVLKHTLENCRRQGWAIHAQVWNVALYMNIAAHDLSVLVAQLHFEREPWARRLIARHVVLAMYEVTEDMTQLLGRRLREPLQSLGLLAMFDAELRQARAPLDAFWRQHQEKLSEIRVMSAAHRDLDGLALLETVESLDMEELFKLGLEIGTILNDIGPLIQKILSASSEVRPPRA